MRHLLAVLAFGFTQASAAPAALGVLPHGVWVSEGYGYVARADGRQVQTYDVSTAGCVRGPRYAAVAFRDLYGTASASDADGVVLQRGPTRDELTRVAALPPACRKPLHGADPALNFNVFAQTFSERYAFFAERGVDWPTQVAAARVRVTAGADLFDTLVALVAPLNDGHVTIRAGSQEHDLERIVAPGAAPDGTAWTWRTLRSSLRDFLQGADTPLVAPATFAGNRRVLTGRLAPDIGYMAILAEGGWAEGQTEDTPAVAHAAAVGTAMEVVLADFADMRGIVIDLRANSGGFDAVSTEIAARFARTPTIAFRKHAHGPQGATPTYDHLLEPAAGRRFAGPIAVLIGPNTVSAGESLALSLAALPQARLFGQPTRGELSDAIPKTLPNGWTFTLSVESYLTPEGALVEGAGVKPDEQTSLPTALADLWGPDIARARTWISAQPR